MLDSWIIEELKRREDHHIDEQRPVLELPVDDRRDSPTRPSNDDEVEDHDGELPRRDRGVVIISL